MVEKQPMAPIEPIKRTKVPLAVAAQLQRLLAEEYQAGDKLPAEKVLGEWFGVGRSSIREALSLMEAEGRVQIVHGVGTFVTDGPKASANGSGGLLVLEQSTVPELFEARRALESETAMRAAERLTASGEKELQELLGQLCDGKISDDVYVQADVALHSAIARATNNRVLVQLFGSLESQLVEYSRRVIWLSGRRETANEGHRAMVEAILARDQSAAREAVIEHLEAVERDIAHELGRGEVEGKEGK